MNDITTMLVKLTVLFEQVRAAYAAWTTGKIPASEFGQLMDALMLEYLHTINAHERH